MRIPLAARRHSDQGNTTSGGVGALHSLRGDDIDEMRAQDIDGRARRLQAGPALGDEHDQYTFCFWMPPVVGEDKAQAENRLVDFPGYRFR
jgi:hypothetical protein